MGLLSVDQVEEGEQIDPDQVHQVPVQGDQVDRGPELLGELAALIAAPDPEQHADAHDDVDAVYARGHEVDRKERR